MEADTYPLTPAPPVGGLVEAIARAYTRPHPRPCKIFLSRSSWAEIIKEAAQVGLAYERPQRAWWLFWLGPVSPVFMEMEVCFSNDYETGEFELV